MSPTSRTELPAPAVAQSPRPVTLRDGEARDVKKCVSLWLAALQDRDGREPPQGTVKRITDKFRRPIVRFAVAERDQTLAGFALTTTATQSSDDASIGYLELLAVDHSHSGLGIGRQLLDDAIEAAHRDGFDRFELDVREGNARALRLYESVGMTVSGPVQEHPLGGRPFVPLALSLNPDAAQRGQL